MAGRGPPRGTNFGYRTKSGNTQAWRMCHSAVGPAQQLTPPAPPFGGDFGQVGLNCRRDRGGSKRRAGYAPGAAGGGACWSRLRMLTPVAASICLVNWMMAVGS